MLRVNVCFKIALGLSQFLDSCQTTGDKKYHQHKSNNSQSFIRLSNIALAPYRGRLRISTSVGRVNVVDTLKLWKNFSTFFILVAILQDPGHDTTESSSTSHHRPGDITKSSLTIIRAPLTNEKISNPQIMFNETSASEKIKNKNVGRKNQLLSVDRARF